MKSICNWKSGILLPAMMKTKLLNQVLVKVYSTAGKSRRWGTFLTPQKPTLKDLHANRGFYKEEGGK